MEDLKDIQTLEGSLNTFAKRIHEEFGAQGVTAIISKTSKQESNEVVYALYLIGKYHYNYRLLEISIPIEEIKEVLIRAFQNSPEEIKVKVLDHLFEALMSIRDDRKFKHIIQHMITMDEIIKEYK